MGSLTVTPFLWSTRMGMKKLLVIFFITLLTGCAAQQRENNKIANSLNQKSPQAVLEEFQESEPSDTDIAQYHLNVGLLQFKTGDFPAAIKTLEQAKKEMAIVQAMSVTETAAAATVNETFRAYSGYPTDRVMVHNILALSYLFNDDIDGARVEILQAEVAMKKLTNGKSLLGQLASTHIISGIIYELLDEQSNALISYRKADKILHAHDLETPTALKQALLRMSYLVDKKSRYIKYKKRFPGFPTPTRNDKSTLFVLYFDGVVDHKKEVTILVPNHDNEQLIRISMPNYPKEDTRISRGKITANNSQLTTQMVENLEVQVREDLSDIYPSILLMTTSRALLKYQVVKEANKQSSLIGVLVNIMTVISEVADLRSWNMLPSNIQFAYVETNDEIVKLSSANTAEQQVHIKQNSKNLLLINSLTADVFHYQQ